MDPGGLQYFSALEPTLADKANSSWMRSAGVTASSDWNLDGNKDQLEILRMYLSFVIGSVDDNLVCKMLDIP